MTHPINIKGGAALDWTRDNPGKELVASGEGSTLRLRYNCRVLADGRWEYQGKRTQYPVDWERLTDFQWALARSWSAPQRELPPTPEGYRWEIDGDTGDPIALVSDELPGRAVLRDERALQESIRFVLLQQALIAEYQGRVKP